MSSVKKAKDKNGRGKEGRCSCRELSGVQNQTGCAASQAMGVAGKVWAWQEYAVDTDTGKWPADASDATG